MIIFMSDYNNIEKDALIAHLMEYTQRLIRMIASGTYAGEDFSACRDTIMAIQNEIKKRDLLHVAPEPTPFLNPGADQQTRDAVA
jgi:hypothetical protein